MSNKFEQIGLGGSKAVFTDKRDPETKVRAEFHDKLTAEEAKSVYYLSKISHWAVFISIFLWIEKF